VGLGEKICANKVKIVTNEELSNSILIKELGNRSNTEIIRQEKINGTAGALISVLDHLEAEYALIVCGDTPFIDSESECIRQLLSSKSEISLIGMIPPDSVISSKYGEIIMCDGRFKKIVEYHDAESSQGLRDFVANSGVYKIKRSILEKYLPKIEKNEKTQELYLTELPNLASSNGVDVNVIISYEYWQFHGINTKNDLALAEAHAQEELRNKFLSLGTTMLDPSSVFFSFDTEIALDVEIEQNVVIKEGVKIGHGATIKAFSYLENCSLGPNAEIGPFARIRGASITGKQAIIGNFVEIKGSVIGDNTKIKHLAYIGDAEIGNETNIGAGSITCNYDGKRKHKTKIGKNAMIGANTSIIAPISIGSFSKIGAGSVIVEDVPDNSLGISRPSQITKPLK
jgi:bifunctional UDP-N-acetylglucosamine pyrophosphorylase/glucosamine-1-phosphate N-acetyltransferase